MQHHRVILWRENQHECLGAFDDRLECFDFVFTHDIILVDAEDIDEIKLLRR